MKITKLLYNAFAGCLFIGCTADDELTPNDEQPFTLQTEILPFDGEGMTRAALDGTKFEDGDKIRLKIICPFVTSTEHSETTYGNTYDAFFLLKKTSGGWAALTKEDKFDISGTYSYSGSPYPGGSGSYVQAQQTPHVYMASTWTEEKCFSSSDSETSVVLQYSHVFHADQRADAAYKASDLLWAQQYMQTAAWNVKLSFQHVMSRLVFTVNDDALTEKISANAVLTLEGMPDIDQQEVVVGDYYAAKSKINSRYSYQQKASCQYENNGKVIGIGVNDDTQKKAFTYPMTGNPNPANNTTYPAEKIISNKGIYTAHKTDLKQYCMIVPPCDLGGGHEAKLWLRDGERRFVMTLNKTVFEQGKSCAITVTLTTGTELPETPETPEDDE